MSNNNNINSSVWHEVCSQLGLPDPKDWDIHKMLHGYSYAFLVIYVLNAVGIEHGSDIIKAISKVQRDLDHIMNDLNQFKNIMEAIEGLDFPDGYDPSSYTDPTNIKKMEDIMKKWMTDPKGWTFKGKKCSPAAALQSIWKDLFGAYPTKDGGYYAKLKTDLANPAYDQSKSSKDILSSLENLNSASLWGSNTSDWKADGGFSLLDFLRNDTSKGDVNNDFSEFARAFCHNYYNKTGTQPSTKDGDTKHDSPDTKQYNAAIDDLVGNTDSSKNMLNGLNTTESSDLSMYSQNVTSMIQEGQQIVQACGQETKAYAQNQLGR